jgi:hypothetical protein
MALAALALGFVSQVVAGGGEGSQPLWVDGLTAFHAQAIRPSIDTLQGGLYLAKLIGIALAFRVDRVGGGVRHGSVADIARLTGDLSERLGPGPLSAGLHLAYELLLPLEQLTPELGELGGTKLGCHWLLQCEYRSGMRKLCSGRGHSGCAVPREKEKSFRR